MTDPAPIRIALVGCGRISRNHFEAIEKIDGLELAAVCDVVADRAQAAGERYGLPWFESFDEMLASARFDAVALCTPSGLHPKHGILAASAGKHVICEKPMAISLDGADQLVGACDAAGVQLFVVKQNRLNPAIQLLKRAIDRERFGRIYLANTTVRWTRPQEYYDQAPWRGTWEFDGGAIMNQASHYVDLIQWLVGRWRASWQRRRRSPGASRPKTRASQCSGSDLVRSASSRSRCSRIRATSRARSPFSARRAR
jgi:UDP-N-acetyl-2-amino-2-deoxyglucuronate dehydrogenase